MSNVLSMAQAAKAAATELLARDESARVNSLIALAMALETNREVIQAENAKDIAQAEAGQLPAALIDRLRLDDKTIKSMIQGCREIAAFPAVVGQIVSEQKRADGLTIQKQRIPIGVVGMVFESRPNVVIDGAALAIKSANAILLKGGKEALHSNRILAEIVQKAIAPFLPAGSVQLLETREDVMELLKLNQYVDLMVPRGGEGLIRFVKEHATMPVVAHDRGLCHVYLHADADPQAAQNIVINAKTQRPSACNAMESLLVHKDFPTQNLSQLLSKLQENGVRVHACPRTVKLATGLIPATPKDYDTEWLAPEMSVLMVDSAEAAIQHIQKHGTHHTEAVVTQTPGVIELFLNAVDASCLAINASTRFNDGGELGLGAELGISTSKLHAYGPMGAQEMTTTRFIVRGNGHVRK